MKIIWRVWCFGAFDFPVWPWFSDLISELIHTSWRPIHCHLLLSGGLLTLTRQFHWPLLWPYLSTFFSVRLFTSPSSRLSPGVTHKHTQEVRVSWELCSPFVILDLCPRCIPAALGTPPKWCRAGWVRLANKGRRRGQQCLMGHTVAAKKGGAAGNWDSCWLGRKWPLNLTLFN